MNLPNPKIILLSSFHKITGKCNPSELYKIIEELQPEVIFEELSVETFALIYSAAYQPQSLEAITIKEYLKKFPIMHFPVDTYPLDGAVLFSGATTIWEYSNEYRKLWDDNLKKINRDGYSYINSEDCAEILDKITLIEESVLLKIQNMELLSEFDAEKLLHDKREDEMLQNIYNYSEQYSFDKALFVCGAQHRSALKRKIHEYEANEIFKLDWTFYNDMY